MYDLVIIGGGPAGISAGVYAARKKLKTAIVAKALNGQSVVSDGIENWIGEITITGLDLAKKLEAHLRAQEGIEIVEGDTVDAVQKKDGAFVVKTGKGRAFEAKTVLVASGSHHRTLNVPGEKELNAKGVFYCSVCDAPIMKGKAAAVVGGGNSALEAVIDLLPYAERVYLLHRRDVLKGDPITQEKIIGNPKVTIIYNAVTDAIEGAASVEALRYHDAATNESKTLAVQGIFVEIGAAPNSDLVKDLVTLDEFGQVVVDPRTQRASCPGIWAAGDVSDGRFKQNNISAGDAVKAILDIYDWLHKNSKN